MEYLLLDGKTTATEIRNGLREEIQKADGRPPCLAVVIVGENPASQIYVRNKEKACKDVGIETKTLRIPGNISQTELEARLDALNADSSVDGILLQLPLPQGLNALPCIERISPAKDVDGLTTASQGLLFTGKKGLRPCTPSGVLALLDRYGIPTEGRHAVILGRSSLVGRPLAAMLSVPERNATVTLCHSRTADLPAVCRTADILIAAIGKPRFVTRDMVKPGAVVIDVGINRNADGKVCGDVDFEEVAPLASAITPVPGGIGPMTVALLLVNTVEAWKQAMRND